MTDKTECTCGRVAVGMQILDTRNWHPDCPLHGLGTDWYNSDEQTEKRRRDRYVLVERYRKAREAREKYRNEVYDE